MIDNDFMNLVWRSDGGIVSDKIIGMMLELEIIIFLYAYADQYNHNKRLSSSPR